MNKNIEKIFLGLLWLMMVSLAITFWMSVNYGFNIFSGAHWTYLSSLQANRAQIKPGFYTSLIVALGIALGGLYFLVRPHFRKINLKQDNQTKDKPVLPTTPQPNSIIRPSSPLVGQIQKDAPKQIYSTATTSNAAAPTSQKPQVNENPLAEQISNVLETAGYLMKPCKKIGDLMSPVVALGYNETLWIGASNISPAAMMSAIDKITNIFEDTLGDSAHDISLHGCIIAPSDTENPDADKIALFEDIDKFKEFMENNKNVLPPDYDAELFEAISTYISTVVGHLGKQ